MATQTHLKEQVKQAELKVAAFIVEHNLLFQVMDHLSDLVSKTFPDSKIALVVSTQKHAVLLKI